MTVNSNKVATWIVRWPNRAPSVILQQSRDDSGSDGRMRQRQSGERSIRYPTRSNGDSSELSELELLAHDKVSGLKHFIGVAQGLGMLDGAITDHLSLYCDASGNEREPITVVGGVLASVDDWTALRSPSEEFWNVALRRRRVALRSFMRTLMRIQRANLCTAGKAMNLAVALLLNDCMKF